MLWKLKAGFRPQTFKQTQEISSVKPTNQERDLLNAIFRTTIKKIKNLMMSGKNNCCSIDFGIVIKIVFERFQGY